MSDAQEYPVTSWRWRRLIESASLFWLLLALGLGLRGYHYVRNPPVWHDEQALIWNVLTKHGAELLGPLHYSEAAPPLFMVLEQGVVAVAGDSTFALRLLPFLASCAALLLLAARGRRCLTPASAHWFVLLLACSDMLLWHCCEAKPYAVDFLLGACLLFLAQGVTRPQRPGVLVVLLLALAAVAPALVFLSFPACFLLGGMALTLLPAVWQARRWTPWLALGCFGVLLCGSFALLLFGPIHAQRNEHMLDCWVGNFPTWSRPWTIPGRAVQRVTEVFRYAQEPTGNALSLLAIPGGVWLWRAGQRRLLAQAVAPMVLTLFAWLVCQYPFGPSRVCVFLAPGLLLLVAAGLPLTLDWLGQRSRWLAAPLMALVLYPVGLAGFRTVQRWNRLDSATPTSFILSRRLETEPVVGTRWEQLYYCRELGDAYRPLTRKNPTEPLTVPPTSREGLPGIRSAADANRPVDSLWLLGTEKGADGSEWLEYLEPRGLWEITERDSRYRDLEVYRVRAKR